MSTLFSEAPGKPRVVTWYSVYCAAMALLYVLLVCAGVAVLVFGLFADRAAGKLPMQAMGAMYVALGVLFMVPFAAAPFLPPKPWNWVYGIVMIALGMTSCCLLPATIPLLIFWLKPETRRYFGREA